jgi:hypothetical protein
MRNTPWLRQFVSKWWTVVDRSRLLSPFLILHRSVKCDQDAFDILYDSYQHRYDNGDTSVGNIREKVAILDRDALNSGSSQPIDLHHIMSVVRPPSHDQPTRLQPSSPFGLHTLVTL